ncbi:MAG: hypothetical protein ACOC04_06390 [Halothece sp.]
MMDFETYLRSLSSHLSRGSERTHYPALKTLLVGYVEAKDIQADLNAVEKTEQLQRYQEAFPNLILTNYS